MVFTSFLSVKRGPSVPVLPSGAGIPLLPAFEVAAEHLRWLHITVLELLACGFNIIATARLLPRKRRCESVAKSFSNN